MTRTGFEGIRQAAGSRGFVLIAALIFMILMTLIGLSVANSTTVEERMARNFRDQDVAFSAAEAALRDAKLHLSGAWQWPYAPVSLTAFAADCTNGLCESIYTSRAAQPIDTVDFYGATAPGANSRIFGAVTSTTAISGVAAQPRYMIEVVCTNKLTDPPCDMVYRVTAQAQGRFASTRVVLQEIYRPAQKLN